MPTTCAVIGCVNRSGRDKVSFFRLPKVISHQGDQTKEKSEKRRRLWIEAINRLDIGNSDQFRVCSVHFISGRPAALYDEKNPDWVPTLKLMMTNVDHRYSCRQTQKEKAEIIAAATSLLELKSSLR